MIVGLFGVGMNLGAFSVLADGLGVHRNLAAALAIEGSLVANFFLHDVWTFEDRGRGERRLRRAARYHLVTGSSGVLQWLVFVTVDGLLIGSLVDPARAADLRALGWLDAAWRVVFVPPDTGALKYVAQVLGLGVAVTWSFAMNFHWTWRGKS